MKRITDLNRHYCILFIIPSMFYPSNPNAPVFERIKLANANI